MHIGQVKYALWRIVPAMRDWVTLRTPAGQLTLRDRDAERVSMLVETMLRVKLRRWQRAQQRRGLPID
jgi:hypothetical protein